jgi:hypothetical protein
MTSWLRRKREQVQDQVREQVQDLNAPDPGDQPEALLGRVGELNRFVNANAGKLPGEAVVVARRITDVVRDVIRSADDGAELDIHAVISIKGILGDYLPTTLHRYLALDPATLDAPRPSGRSPNQSLRQQLDALYAAADDLLTAARAHDADALLSQGSFLRTKFTGSDLDL